MILSIIDGHTPFGARRGMVLLDHTLGTQPSCYAVIWGEVPSDRTTGPNIVFMRKTMQHGPVSPDFLRV
jgi:hypothetical protein